MVQAIDPTIKTAHCGRRVSKTKQLIRLTASPSKQVCCSQTTSELRIVIVLCRNRQAEGTPSTFCCTALIPKLMLWTAPPRHESAIEVGAGCGRIVANARQIEHINAHAQPAGAEPRRCASAVGRLCGAPRTATRAWGAARILPAAKRYPERYPCHYCFEFHKKYLIFFDYSY